MNENAPQFTIEDDDGSIFVKATQDVVWINVPDTDISIKGNLELKGDAARLIVAWINRDADTIRAIADKMERDE